MHICPSTEQICRAYKAIYDAEGVKEDASRWEPILKKICWFLALSVSGVETTTLLHSTLGDKRLLDLPLYKALLEQFAGKELINWDEFGAKYGAGAWARRRFSEEGKTRMVLYSGFVLPIDSSRSNSPYLS